MKISQFVLNAVAVAWFSTGCHPSRTLPLNPQAPRAASLPQAAPDGGVSGGGGEIQAGDRVSRAELISIIDHGRAAILMYFNYQNILFHMLPEYREPLRVKLYGGERTILDIVAHAPIDKETKGACVDEGGQERDGSASVEKQRVCISLVRLENKLTTDVARLYTLGLLAHEFSHLVGTSEEEADGQQGFFQEVMRHNSESQLTGIIDDAFYGYGAAAHDLDEAVRLAQDEEAFCKRIGTTPERLVAYHVVKARAFWVDPLSYEQLRWADAAEQKTRAAAMYACSGSKSPIPEERAKYESRFGSSETLTLPQWEKSHPWLSAERGPNPEGFLIRRIRNLEDLRREVSDARELHSKIAGFAQQIMGLN